MPYLPRAFWLTLLVPLGLLLVGTVGFHLLEEKSPLDSLYWTVVTLATIGYGDMVPLTDAGKWFTLTLVLSGVFSFFYAATALIRAVVSGELAASLGKHKMERTIAQLNNHIIVCGFGRMGRLVCKEFSRENVPYVLIDENEQALQNFRLPHGIPVIGDATSDDVLRRAGVERARGLVAVMDSDANNLFVTLSGRLLNAKMYIVARVEDMETEQKLIRAGANRVISPYQIGGSRVAQAVLRPTVQDFIELTTRTEHIELQMEEALIRPESALAGKSLRDNSLGAELKVIVVAIKQNDGEMLFNPPAETILHPGATLVALGHREQLAHLDRLAKGKG